MAKRIKVHPIGYAPIQSKSRNNHYGEQKKYVQTIKMRNGQIRSIQHYF